MRVPTQYRESIPRPQALSIAIKVSIGTLWETPFSRRLIFCQEHLNPLASTIAESFLREISPLISLSCSPLAFVQTKDLTSESSSIWPISNGWYWGEFNISCSVLLDKGVHLAYFESRESSSLMQNPQAELLGPPGGSFKVVTMNYPEYTPLTLAVKDRLALSESPVATQGGIR